MSSPRGGSALSIKQKFLYIFIAAIIIRIPLWLVGRGLDLRIFMDASKLWPGGSDPYAVKEMFPYPPLYLYMIQGAYLISGGVEPYFHLLAKLPQLIADILTGAVIFSLLSKKFANSRVPLVVAAAYLFNPLILYNTAFYGRFDQLCSFFCALAFLCLESRLWFSTMLALSFCAKKYTLVFYVYYLFRDRKTLPWAVGALAICMAALCAPIIFRFHAPENILRAIFMSNTGSGPVGMSWQTAMYSFLDVKIIVKISNALVALYFVVLFVFPKRDIFSFASFSLSAFIFFSAVVHEQYLAMAIPVLLMDYGVNRKNRAAALAAVFTVSGFIFNGHYHMAEIIGVPQTLFNLVLAGSIFLYSVAEFKWLGNSPAAAESVAN